MPKQPTSEHSPRMVARVELQDGAMRGKLHLYDSVGGWDGILAKHVVAKLDELKDQGARHLDVHVNSPGGDVFEGVAIHTALKAWDKGEVNVHIDGLAASIASFIAMAGKPITMAPHAMVMIHGPRAIAMGDAEQMKKAAARLEAMKETMAACYADRTGLAKAEVVKMMDAETWMSADEAVKKGFADSITGKLINDDPDEDAEARFRDVASALYTNPPPQVARLLSLIPADPPPHAKESAVTFEELKSRAEAAEQTTAKMQARAETAEKGTAEFLAACGKPTMGEALAVVAGLKETAVKATELQAEIGRRDAEAAKAAEVRKAAEVVALFDEASKSGRLTPARRAELAASDLPFTKCPVQLKAFVDSLQPVVVPVQTAAPADSGKPVAQLTDDEKAFADQLKIDPAMVLEFKSKK